MSSRIQGLDGIRAYAALMVVVSHMYLFIDWYYDKSPLYSLVRGIIGVQIFFHFIWISYYKPIV